MAAPDTDGNSQLEPIKTPAILEDLSKEVRNQYIILIKYFPAFSKLSW